MHESHLGMALKGFDIVGCQILPHDVIIIQGFR